MLKSWSQHINNNSTIYAINVAVVLVLIGLFTKLPAIDGQLTGLDVENTKYYQSGKKIADFFEISEFIEVKITPEESGIKSIFESLNLIEKRLTKSFNHLHVKSIHQANSLFTEAIECNETIWPSLKKASKTPIIQDLISNDTNSFLLIVILDSIHEFELEKFDSIMNLPYDGIESLKSMSAFHVQKEIENSLRSDILLISIIIFFLFTVLISYIYRDFKALIYTTIIILISILPTLFLFTILDIPINLITALTIPIILVLSLADAIHLLTGFYNSNKINTVERIQITMHAYVVPSFLTSLTTTIAFASFLMNSAQNIQNFGLIVSCSVLPSFFLTYMVSPYLLKFIQHKSLRETGIKKYLKSLIKHRRSISYVLVLSGILSIPFITKLSFKTDFDSFIPNNTITESNKKELSKDFNSQLSLSILIEKDSLGKPKRKQEIENDILSIIQRIDTINSIGSIKSIKNQIDFKEKFGAFSHFVHFPNKGNPYRSVDKQSYRIEVRLTDIKYLSEANGNIEMVLDDFSDEYDYHIFSKALLMDEINQNVAQSLFSSLLFSFLFIFSCILLLTKSLVTTLISLFVNVVPLSFIVLIFFFGNLDLNILTAITTVVCLGIIVDDTIHVIYRIKILQQENEELGFSIITTSIILIGGFLTFVLSSFEPCRVFGIVSAMVFFITLITDLTLLPFLLDSLKKNKSPSSPLSKADK